MYKRQILERVNHGFPVHYIPYGMDATVNWGFTDLKMRNDSPLPVKIRAETSDGYARLRERLLSAFPETAVH